MSKIKQFINKKIVQPTIIRNRRNEFDLPPMTVISSDCSGGVLCHDYGLPLDSPTINLIIEDSDFISFCQNLPKYLQYQLIDGGLDKNNGYPIAYCGDIKIKGVHYHTFDDLSVTWNRRKARVHYDNIVYIMTQRQIITPGSFDSFMKLDGKKLFLSSENFAAEHDTAVGLNNFDRMFLFDGYSGHRYIDKEFNFAKWYYNHY